MNPIFIAILLFTAALASQAMAENTDGVQGLDNSSKIAQAKKLTYLPQYIQDQQRVCSFEESNQKAACFAELQKYAQEILSCPNSPKRFDEGVIYDEFLAAGSFLQNEKAQIPAEIQSRFDRLVQAVKSRDSRPFNLKLELGAYKSPTKNAHAAVGGKIFLSEGLWKGQSPSDSSLSLDEITAILAHEVGHVIEHHGMLLNCMAIEWTGVHFSVREAHAAFQEDFRGSTRFEIWSEFSQKIEYDADRAATLILKAAGLNPNLMAQALEKLKPKADSGFSSGSHPEFDIRIKAAYDAAALTLK